jgi:hypothetical protein
MAQGTNKALIISFVLIAGLVIFSFLDYTGMVVKDEEGWACSQYACDKAITAQDWINSNCYIMPNTNNEVVCKVVVDNKEQLVPLSSINQQALNQCVEARCVQEARVRTVNYTVDLTTGKPKQ